MITAAVVRILRRKVGTSSRTLLNGWSPSPKKVKRMLYPLY